jgi:dGTPase
VTANLGDVQIVTSFLPRPREQREADEARLSPAATRSTASRGRVREEAPDRHRTAFERDRDRILHSKAFRRLKHKTQVFLNPTGDHYVTRLTHALQVTQVARSLAAALGLNEPLAEAIALAHDVGHTPFGHTGEEALEPYFDGGWHHASQGVRIYEVLEDRNLTWEVRDGIRAHTWRIEPPPATTEGRCVRYADRIAYLTHDALDAIRAGVLTVEALPERVRTHLGPPGSGWIGRMIDAVVDETLATDQLSMAPETAEVMAELRAFLFERVYHAGENLRRKAGAIAVIRALMDHHLANPGLIPASYRDNDADLTTQAADYVAGMTDRFALAQHDQLFRPRLFDPPPLLGDPT